MSLFFLGLTIGVVVGSLIRWTTEGIQDATPRSTFWAIFIALLIGITIASFVTDNPRKPQNVPTPTPTYLGR